MPDSNNLHDPIRDLISAITKTPSNNSVAKPVEMMLAKVMSNDGDTCSIIMQGDTEQIPGIRWLIDAYTPTLGDIVVLLKSGTNKFIIGRLVNLR